MLPTTGFFKDIDCPYYESACGRPYCHFRHRKKNQEFSEDSQDSIEQSHEVPTYNPTPKSQLQNVRSHIPISYVPDIVVRTERPFRTPPTCSFNSVTYNPTPLSELSKNRGNSTNTDGEPEFSDNENVAAGEKYNNDIDFGDDFDFTSECALIDDIINEKNEENIENCEINKTVDKKAPDKTETKIIKEKNRTSTRKEEKSKSKSSNSSLEKSNKSESKDKSKSRSENSNKERKSSSSKSSDNKEHKSGERKHHKEHSKSSHRHKDSNKNHHKDKHKPSDDKRHKNKDKEKSKDSHRDKSKHDKKGKHDSRHRDKNKLKEKDRQKKKSESEGDEKIAFTKEIMSEEENFNELDEFVDDDDLNNPSLEEECYRIFSEYKPEPINRPDSSKEPQIVQEYIPTPKKRIAHQGAENVTPKITHEPPKPSQNPALAMMNRFKVARQTQANNEQKSIVSEVKSMKRLSTDDANRNIKLLKTVKEITKDPVKEQTKKVVSASLIDDIINGTSSAYVPKTCDALMKTKVRRIAPVHNVYSIQQAKAKIAEFTKCGNASKTPIQTISKGSKRVAHVPDTSMGDIPDVLQAESKKIPLNIRTRYLTLLADECLKLYLLKQDAYERALNEEVKVMERCSAIVTYRNSAMLSVNRVRKELQEREAKGLGPISPDDVDTDDQNSPFKGKLFYQNVSVYLLTDEELDIHGYPKEGPVTGKAIIKSQKALPKVNLNSNQRLCCRCFKVYIVDDRGFPMYEEECQYHPLKKRTIRGDRIYLCCKSSEDTGCATASSHVCETEAELEGYQTTMAPSSDDDPRSYAVYALDCEMCYTTKGLELTRVTIVDPDCKTVYESLVKPLHPIIDYNTQFSGITKEQMDRTSTSILQVQANILHLCNSKTILIGHSLESDMKALKIIHTSIIDTSVLFPHRLGLPHKKALRVLASEFLKKIIQNDINGHDSAEDALTCMELVIWKLKEDLKTRNVKT